MPSLRTNRRTDPRQFLKLGSLNLLMADLRNRGIVTKVRALKTGETVGGSRNVAQIFASGT
jgi:hypothetical protein